MKRWQLIAFLSLFLIMLVAIAGLLFMRNKKDTSSELPRGTSREYTFTELQANNTSSSCWVSFGAQVFDITRLVASLETDQANELAKVCGTNLETLPPSIKTTEKLSQYQIGILVP